MPNAAIRKRIDGLLEKNREWSKTYPGTFEMWEVRKNREEIEDRLSIRRYSGLITPMAGGWTVTDRP
jgi:hypothetical protein